MAQQQVAEVIFGVDVGTSSTKAVLVTPTGDVVATAVRRHDVTRPRCGHVEMDAQVWWSEFVSLAEELTPQAQRVLAVGVSGMGPCIALTGADGQLVRPAILYGVDSRATRQIDELNKEFGAETILQRCGSPLTSQAVGPKLAWVRHNEPHVWQRAKKMFMPSSWLTCQLTGAYVLDQHSASQCTPLYDAHEQDWIADWADEVAPGLELPRLVWPADVVGEVRTQIAGIAAGTPVIAGTIDAWTESLSVAATQPGDLMLMYGTTMFLVATVPEPLTTPSMWGTTGIYPGTYNLAGGLATSGAVTQWLRGVLGGLDYAELLSEAAASGVGARGLVMLPYFAGERTPIQDPQARGVVVGMTLDTTRGDLYRAVLEGVGFAVRHNVETMRAAGADIRRVVAVGGGVTGSLWTQIISDITGLEQVIREHSVGASLGAAMLAAHGGLDIDISSWNPTKRVVQPNLEHGARYDQCYSVFRDLYPATAPLVHELAAAVDPASGQTLGS